jgi:hypothetical protein
MDEENQVIGQMNVTVSIVQALKSVQNNRQIHSEIPSVIHRMSDTDTSNYHD